MKVGDIIFLKALHVSPLESKTFFKKILYERTIYPQKTILMIMYLYVLECVLYFVENNTYLDTSKVVCPGAKSISKTSVKLLNCVAVTSLMNSGSIVVMQGVTPV